MVILPNESTYNRLMRLPDVIAITGLKRSTIYHKMKKGDFPKSVSIGERSVAWVEGEINNWININISRRVIL
ncbi:TPA: AlpA family transcriptional regulator [Serratia liquefaciens]|uniref:AlpA family transcriptional regulator n=1 Tax=Serratia proteamaculans TaxID=28151 RepID=UPI0021BD77F9|nr:AlpA family transcriptional regulator [Serratia proteamaculans]HEI8952079.1 AlpA family transcriptional regulator [Serratia liquefaciens]